MSALSHSILFRPPRTLREIVTFAVMVAKRIGVVARHRREAAALAGFNDRMLADIGLTRSDLHDAYAEPWWRDPSRILARRARERRVAHRRHTGPLLRRLFVSPSIAPRHRYER